MSDSIFVKCFILLNRFPEVPLRTLSRSAPIMLDVGSESFMATASAKSKESLQLINGAIETLFCPRAAASIPPSHFLTIQCTSNSGNKEVRLQNSKQNCKVFDIYLKFLFDFLVSVNVMLEEKTITKTLNDCQNKCISACKTLDTSEVNKCKHNRTNFVFIILLCAFSSFLFM